MISIQEKSACCGCAACAQACPKGAITMCADADGFLYPSVDMSLCVECGLCERVCPMLQKKVREGNELIACAFKSKDDALRRESSSGGAFTEIAKLVLREGGAVFGAAFDAELGVKHISVETEEELALLRGSKYAQSEIGDCYRRAEALLKGGRLVLFSGTPCQISGLYAYLRKEYENLITVDFICHGVPSPTVWRQYVAYRTEQAGGEKPTSVSFREKSDGWKNYRVYFSFENGKIYKKPHYDDDMMRVFLQDLCLRESCYSCPFRGTDRPSDITLADFWGIGAVLPELDDDRGTSLVLLGSSKGQKMFSSASASGDIADVEFSKALAQNPAYFRSPARPTARDAFVADAMKDGFQNAVKRHCKRPRFPLLRKLKRLIKRILRR